MYYTPSTFITMIVYGTAYNGKSVTVSPKKRHEITRVDTTPAPTKIYPLYPYPGTALYCTAPRELLRFTGILQTSRLVHL